MTAVRRSVATALVLLLAPTLTGCTGADPRPVGDPDARGVPVPAAEPRGAAYGRLMHADGTSVPGATLETSQPFDGGLATFTATVATLGLVCILDTDNEVCPDSYEATLGDDGLWYADREDVERGKALTATAYGVTADADLAGPRVSVSVDAGPAPLHVPDVVLWEPDLSVERGRDGLRVSWAGGGEVPHGPEASFVVTVQGADDFGSPTTLPPVTGTSAVVPGWRTEDQPAVVSVTATTTTDEAAYSYTTRQLRVSGGPVPLSRGATCVLDRGGRLVTAIEPCGLTDGRLDDTAETRAPGECSVDRRRCKGVSHPRLCVDLGSVQPIGLVVVRTPFVVDGDTVELSTDGRAFRTVGPLGETDDLANEMHPVTVPDGTEARFACVRSDYGFSGYALSEISVW